jgi:hypothetical protein
MLQINESSKQEEEFRTFTQTEAGQDLKNVTTIQNENDFVLIPIILSTTCLFQILTPRHCLLANLFGFSQLIHPFSDMNYSLFFTCISL